MTTFLKQHLKADRFDVRILFLFEHTRTTNQREVPRREVRLTKIFEQHLLFVIRNMMAIVVADTGTLKRIFRFCMNWYGKKLLITFQPLSKKNKLSKFHQNWLKIVTRREF